MFSIQTFFPQNFCHFNKNHGIFGSKPLFFKKKTHGNHFFFSKITLFPKFLCFYRWLFSPKHHTCERSLCDRVKEMILVLYLPPHFQILSLLSLLSLSLSLTHRETQKPEKKSMKMAGLQNWAQPPQFISFKLLMSSYFNFFNEVWPFSLLNFLGLLSSYFLIIEVP